MRAYLILVLVLIIGSVGAREITVGPAGADYALISSALRNASCGDIIEVQSGTYHENIYISKNVTLDGLDTGTGMPVIDGSGMGSVITISAPDVILEGFNLTNSGHCVCGNAGVHVQANNCTVINNVIYRNKYGIYVAKGVNNRFMMNDLLYNDLTVYDSGNSTWEGDDGTDGLQGVLESLDGKNIKGNYYSDYSRPEDGCSDANNDGFCDSPRKIEGGENTDNFPLTAPIHF
jgi:parallel beta-helix repeat protein